MNKTTIAPSKIGKKFFVSIIAILVLLIGCVGCNKDSKTSSNDKKNQEVTDDTRTPKDILTAAFEKTFSEGNSLEELLGLSEITESTKNNLPYSSGTSFTIEALSVPDTDGFDSLLEGLGLTINSASDINNKKVKTSIGITYGNTTYLTIGTQLDSSKLYLMVPEFLDGSVSIDFDTLASDLASDSFLAQIFASEGITIPESLSFDLWELISTAASSNVISFDSLDEAYKTLIEQIKIEELDSDSVQLPSDISADKAYSVTISQESYTDYVIAALKTFLDQLENVLSSEPLQGIVTDIDFPTEDEIRSLADEIGDTFGDIVVTVTITKNDYINYMSSTVDIDGDTVEFAAFFTGDNNPLDDLKFKITATIDEEVGFLEFSQNVDADAKTVTSNVELSVPDFTVSAESEGEYTDIQKGKKYVFDLNYLDFKCSEDISFSLSGSTYLDTTSCDVNTPAGTEYELLKMDEYSMESLVNTIVNNVENSPIFSLLFSLLEV